MYCDGWHKPMSHFPSNCCSSTLNPQVILYDGHDSHFYDRDLDILRKHTTSSRSYSRKFDSLNDQPNDNGPNMKLKIIRIW